MSELDALDRQASRRSCGISIPGAPGATCRTHYPGHVGNWCAVCVSHQLAAIIVSWRESAALRAAPKDDAPPLTARCGAGPFTRDDTRTDAQRYTMWCGFSHGHAPMAAPLGELVLYADHVAHLDAQTTEIARLREALAGLVGSSDPEELANMREQIGAIAPDEDARVMQAAIDALTGRTPPEGQ